MSSLCRRALYAFSFVALTFLASGAQAQSFCNEVCDPYFSYCSDYCDKCQWYNVDGSCGSWVAWTCGGNSSTSPCLVDDCYPSWYDSARENRGTYDGNSWSGCTHHRVDWVTRTDANSCNRNASYRSYSFCQDWIDSTKNGCCWPDCCSGYGDNGVGPLSCNGQHSC